MRVHGIWRVIKILLIVLLVVPLFGFFLMLLWNWLMPAIFGLHAINFWQALGLFCLSKILFGNIRGRFGSKDAWRARLIRRWEDMTPEEREKFRSRGISPASGGCGGSGSMPAPDAPKA
jgi:membrane protein required for beta-lactamase induction